MPGRRAGCFAMKDKKKPGGIAASKSAPYDSFAPEPNPEYERFYSELSGTPRDGERSEAEGEYTVVRRVDMRKARRPTATALLHPEYEYLTLAGSSEKKRMRSFLITLKGEGETRRFASHRGEEFIMVQKGAVRIVLDGRAEILREGDSIYYRSSIPHRIENINDDCSIILAVLYGA